MAEAVDTSSDTIQLGKTVTVWLAWTQYGDETIGVYSTREKAIQAVVVNCTCNHPVNMPHNDHYRCGIFETEIDRKIT